MGSEVDEQSYPADGQMPGSSAMNLAARTRELLRPREFAVLTPDARSHERYKRIGLTAIAAMGAKAVSLATTFVSLPLTLHYLGPEQYGLWVTIASVTAFFGLADLGLGKGLINGVSQALGRNDEARAGLYVSSAFYMLAAIAALLGIAFLACYRFVPWPRVFNVPSSSDAAAVAGPTMAVFVALTLVGLPLGVIAAIRAGLQEGFASSVWSAAGSVITLLGLLIAIAANASLPWLILALGGGSVFATVLNGAALFRRKPGLMPDIKQVTRLAAKRMLRFGLLFFILSIAGAVAYQTDNIVIAHLLGPRAVTQYAVPMRLFLIAPLILSFALLPLWPAYGEALARGDTAWVRRTFIRSLAISAVIGGLMSLLLLAFGVQLLHVWVGDTINPTTPLLLALATLAMLGCLTGPIAMYLNGANVLGFQAACAGTMMLANLGLSIALTRAIGISGPAWGSAIAQIVFVLIPCGIYMRSKLSRLTQADRS
jgi:O-antigen/teichoic acid export membrane protein